MIIISQVSFTSPYLYKMFLQKILPNIFYLGIGTLALEMELELELELELILQTSLFPVPLDLRTPNLAGWWLRKRGPHPQSHVTYNIAVKWQIKNKTLYLHFHKTYVPHT